MQKCKVISSLAVTMLKYCTYIATCINSKFDSHSSVLHDDILDTTDVPTQDLLLAHVSPELCLCAWLGRQCLNFTDEASDQRGDCCTTYVPGAVDVALTQIWVALDISNYRSTDMWDWVTCRTHLSWIRIDHPLSFRQLIGWLQSEQFFWWRLSTWPWTSMTKRATNTKPV